MKVNEIILSHSQMSKIISLTVFVRTDIMKQKDKGGSKTKKDILSKIRQRFVSMTPVEKRIASCILEAPEIFVNETITQLAARAKTSSGSIVKFAASMGFKGYSNMKIEIAQGLEQPRILSFDGVDPTDGPKAAMQKLMQAAQTAFTDTYSAISMELGEAAELLAKARRIEIYAAGSSLPVAQDAHYRLMRLGLPAVILPDPLLASMSAAQLGEHDVVIAVSDKGRTNNTLTAAQIAKRSGAKLLVLTSVQDSPLAKLADVALISVSVEAVAYREAVVSRLAQLLIMDSLCAYLAAQRGLDAMRHLDNEIEVLEEYRQIRQEEES